MVFAAALVLRGLYRSYLILPGEFSRSRSFRLPIDPIRPAYVCERAVLYRSHLRSMCERSRYFRSHPGKHVLDHADISIKILRSTRFSVGGKFYGVKNAATAVQQYNQPWCVYVHRKRAVQKGATQGILGLRLPYAVVVPRPSFSIRAAILNSSSSSSRSHIGQHQYRASTAACSSNSSSSSSSCSIAAAVITGKCYNSNNYLYTCGTAYLVEIQSIVLLYYNLWQFLCIPLVHTNHSVRKRK